MPLSSSDALTEEQLRTKYAQDLVRLARRIKDGAMHSELLHVCNVSHPAINSVYRSIVELLFTEIHANQAER